MFQQVQPFLDHFDNPWLWWATLVLIIVPSIIGVLKLVLKFHDEHIRYIRTKSYEYAQGKTIEDTIDYELFKELRNQELFYLNTKIRASKQERIQLSDWICNKPVTIGLIRNAWSMLTIENGNLVPKIRWYDWVIFGYSITGTICSFIAGVYFLIVSVPNLLKSGWGHVTLLGVVLCGSAYLMYYQAIPILYLRRLKYRLESSNQINKKQLKKDAT